MDTNPRIAIGTWPTAIRPLQLVSDALGVEVWAKLEESCGAWGGNKVRKLEYILGRARADGIVRLIGYGAGTSNWTSALAFHGAKQGFEVEVVLSANEIPDGLKDLYRSLGTRVRHVSRVLFPVAVAGAVSRTGRPVGRLLPPGGTGRDGNRGSAHTGEEIASAIRAGQLPRPSKIFVPVGTGGTAAGISMGAARAGEPVDLVCVRVAPRPFGTTRRVARAIRAAEMRIDPGSLQGDDRCFAPGYARPNARSLEAAAVARLDGLELDQTYAAKAFASLIAHARDGERGPLLFVNTSPGSPPEAY